MKGRISIEGESNHDKWCTNCGAKLVPVDKFHFIVEYDCIVCNKERCKNE